MLSSLAAAAMAEICRRSSSGGRFNGCESCVRELRFEEKKPVFEAVEDERLCEEIKSGYDSVDLEGEDLRGDEDADLVGEAESEGEKPASGAGMETPSAVMSVLRGRSLLRGRDLFDFLSLRLTSLVSSPGLDLRSFFLSLSLSLSLFLSGDGDLEKS